MFKQFIRDSLIYTVGNILVRGASYLLLPLYTSVLTPSDYGLTDILQVFVSFASIIVALEIVQGLAIYFSGCVDQEEKIAYASTALWFAMAMFSVFVIICLIFAAPLSEWLIKQPGNSFIFSLSVISAWGSGISYLATNQLRFERKPAKYALTGLISSIATISLTIILVLIVKLGVIGVVVGQMAGNFVSCILAIIFVKGIYKPKFSFIKLKQMLAFSIPLVPSSVGSLTMIYINRLAINSLLTLSDVGIYGLAYRISSIIEFIMMGFRTALTPLIYEQYQKTETPGEIAKIFRYFVAFALLIVLFLSVFSREIVILLSQPSFYDASKIVAILAPAYILGQMNIFTPGWAIVKKTAGFAIINIIGAILAIILNFLLIPILGISGAAWAVLITNSLTFSAFMINSQKYYYVPHKWKNILLSSLFFASLILISIYAIPEYNFISNTLIKLFLIVLGTLFLFFTRLIIFDDIKLLLKKVNQFLNKRSSIL